MNLYLIEYDAGGIYSEYVVSPSFECALAYIQSKYYVTTKNGIRSIVELKTNVAIVEAFK